MQRLNHIWRWCQPKQKVYTSREPFCGLTDSQKDLKLRKFLNSISNSLSSHQRFHLINEFTTIWTSCLFWEIAQLNFYIFFYLSLRSADYSLWNIYHLNLSLSVHQSQTIRMMTCSSYSINNSLFLCFLLSFNATNLADIGWKTSKTN